MVMCSNIIINKLIKDYILNYIMVYFSHSNPITILYLCEIYSEGCCVSGFTGTACLNIILCYEPFFGLLGCYCQKPRLSFVRQWRLLKSSLSFYMKLSHALSDLRFTHPSNGNFAEYNKKIKVIKIEIGGFVVIIQVKTLLN